MSPEEIRELRTRMGLSQDKFARKIGVTQVTVYNWEKGRTEPSELAQNYLKLLREQLGKEH